MALASGRCHDHPDRPGLGVCVECRRVLCAECTTQFEGINRCAACLKARRDQLGGLTRRDDWSFGQLALAALSLVAMYLAFLGASRLLAH